ncbi:MAG: hypothetical protein JWQ64_487 [Subtercola sp.]|nr:hypothetical protein [Subtercola sp.]
MPNASARCVDRDTSDHLSRLDHSTCANSNFLIHARVRLPLPYNSFLTPIFNFLFFPVPLLLLFPLKE